MRKLYIFLLLCIVFLVQSCELFNLELQRDYEFVPAPVDQYLDVNTYEFIQSRKNIDMLYLNLMVERAQLQELYSQNGGYTYILPNDDMISKWLLNKGKDSVDDCTNEEIENFLKSMICVGEYTTLDLQTSDIKVETLIEDVFVYLRLMEVTSVTDSKEMWYHLIINGSTYLVVTSNLRPTNGVIHVIERDFNREYVPVI